MADMHSTCLQCGKPFSYPLGKGNTRRICSDKCASDRRKAALSAKPKKTCTIEGCQSVACRDKDTICEAHYMRRRRNGSFDVVNTVTDGNLVHSGGYLLEYAPGHPLRAGSHSRVYQHRVVYYDAHGDGPFSCHCCGKSVSWSDMHVDHLNDVVTDNRIENLAAACAVCNQQRGRHKMAKTMRANGVIWSAHGLSMCKAEWAKYLGVSRNTIESRLSRGASLEAALVPRYGNSGPKSKR